MRNLFERLKPEYIEKINEFGILYPATRTNLLTVLQSNYFWSDLSYDCIFTLLNHLGILDYSPSTIARLFEND